MSKNPRKIGDAMRLDFCGVFGEKLSAKKKSFCSRGPGAEGGNQLNHRLASAARGSNANPEIVRWVASSLVCALHGRRGEVIEDKLKLSTLVWIPTECLSRYEDSSAYRPLPTWNKLLKLIDRNAEG